MVLRDNIVGRYSSICFGICKDRKQKKKKNRSRHKTEVVYRDVPVVWGVLKEKKAIILDTGNK